MKNKKEDKRASAKASAREEQTASAKTQIRRGKVSGSPSPRVSDTPDLPRWVPLAVYGLVCIVLFRETIFGGARLLGVDNLELGLFARDFYTDFIRNFHRFPVWEPLLYGGLPFIEGMHGDIGADQFGDDIGLERRGVGTGDAVGGVAVIADGGLVVALGQFLGLLDLLLKP